MEVILAAAVTGILTLVGVIFTNYAANKKIVEVLNTTQAVTTEKIGALEKKVEKHNQVIERVYRLEGQMVEVQHDIRDLKK